MREEDPKGTVKTNPYDIEKMNKEIANGNRHRQEEYSIYDPYDLSKTITVRQETKVILATDDSEE